mmetsp:Transcript_15005/g.43326  ORF Transcript_15005/g.43326 Transcript_15005/m.43326 type:complete len:235 (-) Transcript_15005:329-1033(-)
MRPRRRWSMACCRGALAGRQRPRHPHGPETPTACVARRGWAPPRRPRSRRGGLQRARRRSRRHQPRASSHRRGAAALWMRRHDQRRAQGPRRPWRCTPHPERERPSASPATTPKDRSNPRSARRTRPRLCHPSTKKGIASPTPPAQGGTPTSHHKRAASRHLPATPPRRCPAGRGSSSHSRETAHLCPHPARCRFPASQTSRTPHHTTRARRSPAKRTVAGSLQRIGAPRPIRT